MKTTTHGVVTLLSMLIVILFSCTNKLTAQDEPQDEWKEMDKYHMLMAEAFHPFMDSANLEPAKKLAPELAKAAREWRKSTLPAKVNRKEVKEKLAKLEELSAKMQKYAAEKNDKELKTVLNELHDVFHDIQDEWYGGGGHDAH
jgi:hypothetical protein